MCIYTVKRNFKKKNSIKRPKIRRLRRKGYRKTNKVLGMLCYIQVEYSVFFRC